MCEFKILVKEPGKAEYQAMEDISFLKLEDDGTLILSGFGIKETIDSAIISEVNVYADEGAELRVIKAPLFKKFLKFLKLLETGSYSSELEQTWKDFIKNGNALLDKMKKES